MSKNSSIPKFGGTEGEYHQWRMLIITELQSKKCLDLDEKLLKDAELQACGILKSNLTVALISEVASMKSFYEMMNHLDKKYLAYSARSYVNYLVELLRVRMVDGNARKYVDEINHAMQKINSLDSNKSPIHTQMIAAIALANLPQDNIKWQQLSISIQAQRDDITWEYVSAQILGFQYTIDGVKSEPSDEANQAYRNQQCNNNNNYRARTPERTRSNSRERRSDRRNDDRSRRNPSPRRGRSEFPLLPNGDVDLKRMKEFAPGSSGFKKGYKWNLTKEQLNEVRREGRCLQCLKTSHIQETCPELDHSGESYHAERQRHKDGEQANIAIREEVIIDRHLDSGASTNMVNSNEFIDNILDITHKREHIKVANNQSISITHEGKLEYKSRSFPVIIVPGLRHNLFSISSLLDMGVDVIFEKSGQVLAIDRKNENVLLRAEKTENGLFKVKKVYSPNEHLETQYRSEIYDLLLHRLHHRRHPTHSDGTTTRATQCFSAENLNKRSSRTLSTTQEETTAAAKTNMPQPQHSQSDTNSTYYTPFSHSDKYMASRNSSENNSRKYNTLTGDRSSAACTTHATRTNIAEHCDGETKSERATQANTTTRSHQNEDQAPQSILRKSISHHQGEQPRAQSHFQNWITVKNNRAKTRHTSMMKALQTTTSNQFQILQDQQALGLAKNGRPPNGNEKAGDYSASRTKLATPGTR